MDVQHNRKANDATLKLKRCYITQLMISPEKRRCKLSVKYCASVYEQGSEREPVCVCVCVCAETDIQMKLKGFQYSGIAEHPHLAEMKNNRKSPGTIHWRQRKRRQKKKKTKEKARVWVGVCIPLPQTDADAADRRQWVNLS